MRYDTESSELADLELMLAESDREDPYLTQPRHADEPAAEESLNDQILAGLVTP
jgi:hypothetical protein